MKKTITLRNETTITAEGKHDSGNCKRVCRIDKLGRVTTYLSVGDAAEMNDILPQNMSRALHTSRPYKGNKYCFIEQLHENLDYITEKQQTSEAKNAEQEARIAELEAKAAAYDTYVKAKRARDAEIVRTTELVADAQKIRYELEAQLYEARERETALMTHLEYLKANEVAL